jgi:hypothetical protein
LDVDYYFRLPQALSQSPIFTLQTIVFRRKRITEHCLAPALTRL